MNITEILEAFYSEHKWSIVNDDYDKLHWEESNSIEKPSLEDLQDKWDNDKSPIENKIIQQKRQVDILSKWPMEKQFEAITEFHMDRPEKLESLLGHIKQVKDDNPKSS